mgnify:CR=1 FL=1
MNEFHIVVLPGDGIGVEIMDACLALREKVYCELDPGDALFFHCNLLHASGANESDQPRWSIISAYNRLSNRPIKPDEPVSCVTPIARVPDAALLDPEAGGVSAGADFLDKSRRRYQERKD